MPRDTLPVVLYLLGQGGFQPRGSSWLSNLLEELFTHGQLRDVSPGWGIPQTEIPLMRSVVASCRSYIIRMLNFASGGLLNYFWRFLWLQSSSVQFSPVHLSPVISYTLGGRRESKWTGKNKNDRKEVCTHELNSAWVAMSEFPNICKYSSSYIGHLPTIP